MGRWAAILGVSIAICTCAMAFAMMAGGIYGLGLFVATPLLGGFASVWIYTYERDRTIQHCVGVALSSVLSMAVAMLALKWEGLICLLMAAPLAALLAVIGGLTAYAIRRRRERRTPASPAVLGIFLLLSPGVTLIEALVKPESPLIEVRSFVDIDAPPEKVWKNVVSYSELPDQREWLFHTGVSYPIRAHIDGVGLGAVRECTFTTGELVEPVEVWDEPRELRFSVTRNPPPMHELSPFGEVHAAHLDGYLVSKRGQFLLTPLPGGRTRLWGNTWYQHHMWPAAYWALWSDYIIHRIHLRVLGHVKSLSEQSLSRR